MNHQTIKDQNRYPTWREMVVEYGQPPTTPRSAAYGAPDLASGQWCAPVAPVALARILRAIGATIR